MNRRLIALASAWLIFCSSSLQRQATIYGSEPLLKPVTLADVVEALEKRERAAAMVELRWTHSVRYEQGSLLPQVYAKSMELKGKFLEHGVPAEAVEFRYPSELRLKGDQMEFVSKRLRVDPASLSMIDYRSAYDGRESKFQMGSNPETILPVPGTQTSPIFISFPFCCIAGHWMRPLPSSARKRSNSRGELSKSTVINACELMTEGRESISIANAG
jgi:hypothetical protein